MAQCLKALYLILCLSVAFVFLIFEVLDLTWNQTPSLPMGIWRDRGPFEIKEAYRGQVVKFCPPDEALFRKAKAQGILRSGDCPGGYMPLLKRVLGLPGDKVEIADEVRVNGYLIPASQLQTRITGYFGTRKRNMRLGKGELWLMGDSLESFDSRYFGGVVGDDKVRLQKPIFVPAGLWAGSESSRK